MKTKLFIITILIILTSCSNDEPNRRIRPNFYRLVQVDVNGTKTTYNQVKSTASQNSSLRTITGDYSVITKFTMVSSQEIANKEVNKVQDTLIVNGDLDLKNKGDLIIDKGALLVVIGNLTNYNKSDIIVKGHLVVVGILSTKEKTNISNQGQIDLCHKVEGKSPVIGFPEKYDVNLKVRDMLVTCKGLPISLKSFEVKQFPEYDLIEFCTGMEHNSAYVEIQSSIDGEIWVKETQVKSIYDNGGCYSFKLELCL